MIKKIRAILTPLSLISVTIGVAGCSDPDEGKNSSEVTYYQDIAPLYAEKCVKCHQDGGIGPMALDNFKEASKFGRASKAATSNRIMPPYLLVADGSCGEFESPRALSDDEIKMIAQWVDDDMPEGEVDDIPKPKELPTLGDEALSVSTPDFVPEIVGDVLAEFDEYRCFLIDPKISEDTFLTGFEVVPGNAAIVHHVLAFPVDLDGEADTYDGRTNKEVIEELAGESPDREGWPCFGMAGEGVGIEGVPVTWAPGMGAVRYPHGAGVQFSAGNQLVVQVHYNLADEDVRGQSDSTTLKLATADQVERVAFFDLQDALLNSLYYEEPYQIPPGEESHKFEFELDYDYYISAFGSLAISGIMPHMHERGHRYRLELIRGKDEMCRAKVDNWDFNWQLFYFYDEPLKLELGDKLRVTCDFNTEGQSEPIIPGWGTQNEMCLAALMFSVPMEAMY